MLILICPWVSGCLEMIVSGEKRSATPPPPNPTHSPPSPDSWECIGIRLFLMLPLSFWLIVQSCRNSTLCFYIFLHNIKLFRKLQDSMSAVRWSFRIESIVKNRCGTRFSLKKWRIIGFDSSNPGWCFRSHYLDVIFFVRDEQGRQLPTPKRDLTHKHYGLKGLVWGGAAAWEKFL